MIWNDSSMAESGGSLVSGESSMPLSLKLGSNWAFSSSHRFTHNNGYQDLGLGQFEFHDADGSMRPFTAKTRDSFMWRGRLDCADVWPHVSHLSDATHYNLNPDGISHTTAHPDVANGTMTLGFEDMWVGGDYTDLVVELDVGTANAEAMQPFTQSATTWG